LKLAMTESPYVNHRVKIKSRVGEGLN
jgi:hypothetical protein